MNKKALRRGAAIAAILVVGAIATGVVMANSEKIIELHIGDPVMQVNGEDKNIDEDGTAPIIENDRTMLPLRAVAEELGAVVDWDGETQKVTITQKNDDVQQSTDKAFEAAKDLATTQVFSFDPVSDGDIKTILTAGINTPSAMNKQQWHFSAVTDEAVLDEIAADMAASMPSNVAKTEAADENTRPAKAGIADAPLAIVISCVEDDELDAGFATTSMAITAAGLGYGSKIITSPTLALNGDKAAEYRTKLGIPEDQHVAAVLLVGKEDTSLASDTVSAATTRNAYDDTVTVVSGN